MNPGLDTVLEFHVSLQLHIHCVRIPCYFVSARAVVLEFLLNLHLLVHLC